MVIDIMCHGVEHLAIVWDHMRPFNERPAFLPSLGHIVGTAASLGNAMMGIASYQAGVVNFWLEAIRGMRLSDFHNNWTSPMNAMDAMRALWNGRAIRISLVSLLVAATMLARTPIIHSAYHTDAATIPSFGIAAVDMTPNVTHYGFLPYSMAATSLNAFRGLQANQPIMFGEDVCNECTLNALGLGWNRDCWSLDAGWYDFEDAILDARSDSVTHGLFVINVMESTGQGGFRITIRTMRKSEDGYKGMYIGEQCTLSPVVARYELNVRGRFTKFEPKNKIEFVPHVARGV
ncbi:hypothetical protein N0V85_006428 [Neurospora sp. IMI 360204]|nr:hypothetical protein N0V85_006428 [Neurospora sp. IMI 360204]